MGSGEAAAAEAWLEHAGSAASVSPLQSLSTPSLQRSAELSRAALGRQTDTTATVAVLLTWRTTRLLPLTSAQEAPSLSSAMCIVSWESVWLAPSKR